MQGYDIIADGAIGSGLRAAADDGHTARQMPYRLTGRALGGYGVTLADDLNSVLDSLDGALGRVLAQVDAAADATDQAERAIRNADTDAASAYATVMPA